ncbi:heterokaryon incompatibility protein Het-C-domain-containing protein [Calycina marina]|uniref:Heterokaryon incompatibility protein Het-C-domain-containing protein n=1 Tax=Calycina marina TaxID=1763456 RepID=A0A9P7ZAB8_9HELO|nr:heterokaryon incompatibility protein Het-C-domain-containing protein [Calycina marina]
MPLFSVSTAVLTIAMVLLLAKPAHAFGAGNIASVAKIEGSNWRHGDIEDALLTLVMSRAAGGKKWDKMMVARTYFGNWLRDYSQAIDVGTVKYVSAEAIRILLWVLGFMTFGFGTKEFEVTTERLGCYRPEDHIDNPKDYADNEDATQYDRRLRGPVDERVELGIDPQTGLKNYISNERAGIMTSAKHIRNLFGKSIELGRSFARSKNKAELYEALRLLGTGLHCLEDYSAHSNYTELALIEMGERDVFPHVGRDTKIPLQGARNEVYPIVTGTFGGVDFLHSVMGEFSDKATQSEIDELEGTMQNDSRADTSVLKDLLSNIPDGLFGGKDEAGKADELQANATAAQMSQARISPRNPEEFTLQMQELVKQIFPIIEWHDEVMLSITEAIESIPVLPDLIEQVEGEVTKFVFSLLAPFILPLISQIKTELNTGSSEIIQSSKDKQLIVFSDDNSSDPTHSMLSKDHFSNVLNEPAGKIASQVLKWVVPQLVAAWDDEHVDIDRTIDRIINGVFHHPAQRSLGDDGASEGRQLMFQVVETWWGEQDQQYQQELRQKLSREGVENGENHKEGVHDSGHGCGKPLGMHKVSGKGSGGQFSNHTQNIGKIAAEAAGGGALGGLVGAFASGIGGDLLSAFGGEKKGETTSGYTASGDYQQSYIETAHSGNKYGQAEVTETQYSGGGRKTEYSSYEQTSYGQGQATGHGETTTSYEHQERQDDEHSRHGGDNEYGGHSRHDHGEPRRYGGDEFGSGRWEEEREPQSYGGGGYGGYGGEQRREEGYGEHRREEGSGGGFSGHERHEPGFGGGGYGGRERQEEDYGGGGGGYRGEERREHRSQERFGRGEFRDEERQEEPYGREQRGYGGEESMPGGFGDEQQGQGYGERRERRDEDGYDDGESRW